MPSSSNVNIYLGAGDEGQQLFEKVKKHCEKHGVSISEFVKALIVKELNK